MTLEGFVVRGGRGAGSGGHREQAGVVVRGEGVRLGRRGREEVPEEDGGGCADDVSAIGRDK